MLGTSLCGSLHGCPKLPYFFLANLDKLNGIWQSISYLISGWYRNESIRNPFSEYEIAPLNFESERREHTECPNSIDISGPRVVSSEEFSEGQRRKLVVGP